MPDDARWVGWVRRNRRCRWEPVCEAASLDECCRRLDRIAGRRGIGQSNQVVTHGFYPRDDGASGEVRTPAPRDPETTETNTHGPEQQHPA
jgi:hypothetical protein